MVDTKEGSQRAGGTYFVGYHTETTFCRAVIDENDEVVSFEEFEAKVGDQCTYLQV